MECSPLVVGLHFSKTSLISSIKFAFYRGVFCGLMHFIQKNKQLIENLK